MRDKTYAYVVKIDEHYQGMQEGIRIIGNIENIAFEAMEGKAILFDVSQVFELVKKLPDNILSKLKKEDLKGIRDIRNFIVHDYDRLEREKIIDSIKFGIPSLVNDLHMIAKSEYERAVRGIIGKRVDVFVDARLDKETNKLNYGYIDNIVSPNGEFIEAYIVDIDVPVPRCMGYVINAFKRKKEDAYSLLVATLDAKYCEAQIKDLIRDKIGVSDFELLISEKREKR